MNRIKLRDQMAAYFEAFPNKPIDVSELAAIGGISGYRTRVSECRTELGMDIRPEQPRKRWPDGRPRPRAIYYPPAVSAQGDQGRAA